MTANLLFGTFLLLSAAAPRPDDSPPVFLFATASQAPSIYFYAHDAELTEIKKKTMNAFDLRIHRYAGIQEAARLASETLQKMTGCRPDEIPVARPEDVDRTVPGLVLGTLAHDLGVAMETNSPSRDGFRYKTLPPLVLIAGESDRGVFHGLCAFLESLGCGWYTPGEVGEVIPNRSRVTVRSDLDVTETSPALHREYWGYGEWAVKNKGLASAGNFRHAWGNLLPKELFAEKPELFALFRGKRSPRQLCTSNPETVQRAAETLLRWMEERPNETVFECGPSDGGGLCECPECAKLFTEGYVEPSSGLPSYSDLVLKFANDLAAITSRKYPDKLLGFYIYSDYSRPPLKVHDIHPNVFPMMAPIRRCRLHGPGNPICPSQILWQEEIHAWGAMTRNLGFYPYNFNLADTLIPWTKIDTFRRLADEIKRLRLDRLAFTCESINSWAMYAPHLYLSARFMWNPCLDIEETMERFYQGFYAEAAAPMKRYWTRLDETYARTPSHTGSFYGMHHVWTPELVAACRKDFDEARQSARTPRVRQAVEMTASGFRCAELFLEIRRHIGQFDFLKAKAVQDELLAHVEAMGTNYPEWASSRYSKSYYLSFLGRSVEKTASTLAAGGRLLVRFPDRWKARKDETGKGIAEGWGNPDWDDNAWEELATFTKSWDDQGLGWYHGDLWYRIRFDLPAEEIQGDLRLFFMGFDHNVDVWLNGERLPRGFDEKGDPLRSPEGEILYGQTGFMRPAEFTRMQEKLRAGQNVLAVRCSAGSLAELGTGGLMMPVFLYRAPASLPQKPAEPPTPSDRPPVYEM